MSRIRGDAQHGKTDGRRRPLEDLQEVSPVTYQQARNVRIQVVSSRGLQHSFHPVFIALDLRQINEKNQRIVFLLQGSVLLSKRPDRLVQLDHAA